MTMALHASKGSSHEGFPGRIHTVKHSCSSEFFVFSSALIVRHGIPVESRCDILCICGIRHEVAGDLIPDKLIVGLISIKSMDQPVTITPDTPAVVSFVSFGICVSGQVHPYGGPAFPILGRRQ